MNRFRFTIAEVEGKKNICKRCGSLLIPRDRETILNDSSQYSTTSTTTNVSNLSISILPCWYCETCNHYFGRRIKDDED